MSILVLADHAAGALQPSTARVVTAARQIGGDVVLLVAGQNCAAVAREASAIDGVARVLLADADALAHQLPEALAALIAELAPDYDAILGSSGLVAKRCLPRVAALLDVMQVSEIIAVVAPDTFRRPTYAGNAIETVQSTDSKRVLTVRTTAFAPAGAGASAPIETISPGPSGDTRSSFVGRSSTGSDRIELGSARRVVSGGRGLGSRESFDKLVYPLADKLQAAVGASRAAVDAGYVPSDCQVGQTGKVVAPELYLALGISGAIQHLAGMQDSKVIVAINKDPDAPIFSIADYGLAQDLFEAVPELIAKIG
ncbi:FAD-binding protein [Devosia sp. ZB163]|uniref:electron transfer flavoprotein subunit alpha/FixB family protein n=1 Tax=Devosia sp. ZB163 TaxID=3025938 RepID=UPI0023619FFA|nr:FAD-binding protein [Devosia sp. ZB163]MDC9825154.1 FAD-binding protein [Devosia sp. ZB163]